MHAINKDPHRSVLLKHLIIEAVTQYKVFIEKGSVFEQSDAATHSMFEVLHRQRLLVKSISLSFCPEDRDGRWCKDFAEKIIAENKGYDDHQ